MVSPRLAAFVVCLIPVGALAQGTPRSIGECERLKNDLAYNQCLAMFGPAARNVAAGYASVDAAAAPALPEAAPAAEAEAEAPSRGRRYRGRHRRQYAMFSANEGGGYRRRHRR
ncbi:hypothetical protein [Methylobacterium aerolatum]|uniref:Uncharacterized protein n=1 Tax=Methylobacterium aerolatum TaxID=418708 RepID=A0ABU0I5G5_9HYPH|nr:hypothetical protein [Methylobacterium aerolatum]MDQ0449110.1 hypothetical protein [Methylobacterium aerolatum]GJD35298.1 hypothetical protein FMGBMHLM_2207 [Methylobacterium aerolatum]